MIDALLGLLSQDLSLDLGSDRTRVHVRGAGVVLDVATAVALRTRRSGTREVIAIGDEARAMLGRTPAGMAVVRPVRSGRLVETAIADVLLEHLFTQIHGRRGLGRPRVLLVEAPDSARRARRSLRDCAIHAGARSIRALPRPIAAAIGAGLDPFGPLAHMIVDVGAGTTSIGVVCRGTVVAAATLEVGGDVMDGAILRHLRHHHDLLVGTPTAEALKRHTAAVDPPNEERQVAGRSLTAGVPASAVVTLAELSDALQEAIGAIGSGVRRVLEQTPPEVANDIVGHGAFLCGGGARLPQLDVALRGMTGLAMLVLDDPDRLSIDGAGRVSEDRGLWDVLTAPD